MWSDEYQNKAIETAVYPAPDTVAGLIYCALKLAGEAGEVAQKLGKAMRDQGVTAGMKIDDLSPSLLEKLSDETGDCLWYIAVMNHSMGVLLSEVQANNLSKLKDRANRNVIAGSGDNR